MLALSDVLAAQHTVAPRVWRTPLVPSSALSRLTGGSIHLKLESWQRTGSFKVRGSLNKLSALSPDVRALGVVTASAGNHGLGVAHAGQVLGMSSVVAEGAGAIAIAPLLTGQLDATHRTVSAILTGRNLDASLLREILSEYGEP